MSLLALPHPWADAVVLGSLAMAGFVAGFKRSYWCLPLLIAGVVFSAFFVTVSREWGGREIVPISILLGLLLRESVEGRDQRALRFPGPIVAVLVGLGVFASLSLWLAPEAPPGGPAGLQRPSVRPLVQAASYGLVLLYFLIPFWIGIKDQALRISSRGLQLAAAATALYGVYQVMAHRLGFPFRGIQYWAEQEGAGVMSVAGTTLFRMSGLSNEPKQLAVICLVGLVVAVLVRGTFKRPMVRLAVFLLCGLGFVGAWSTGGFLAALVVAAAAGIWLVQSAGGIAGRVWQVSLAAAVVLVGFVILTGQPTSSPDIVRTITFERVTIPGITGEVDAGARIENAVFNRFVQNPHEAMIGLGLGNYPYVVGEHGEWVWSRGIQPMHSMYLTILADFGVLGLLALGIGSFAVFRGVHWARLRGSLRGRLDQQEPYSAVLGVFVALLLVSVFVSLLPLVLLFMGVLYTYHRQPERRSQVKAESVSPARWS